MALRTTWTDENKVISNGRSVLYSSVPEFWSGADVTVRSPIYFTVTRTSTMNFSYIGMSKAAAEQCAAELRREFTRNYMRWTPTVVENTNAAPTVLINQDTVFERSSAIEPRPEVGDDWRVDVSVNETDTIISLEDVKSVDDFETLFQLADQRDFPPATGSIAIVSAKWVSSTSDIDVNFSAVISNFNPSLLGVQVLNVQREWEDVVPRTGTTNKTLSFHAEENKTFRLTYNSGSIVSKQWTTRDREEPNFVIDEASIRNIVNVQNGKVPYSVSSSVVIIFHETSGLSATSLLRSRAYKVRVSFGTQVDEYSDIPISSIGGGMYSAAFLINEYARPSSAKRVSLCYMKDDNYWSNEVSATVRADIDFDIPVCIRTEPAVPFHDTRLKFRSYIRTDLPLSVVENVQIRSMCPRTKVDIQTERTALYSVGNNVYCIEYIDEGEVTDRSHFAWDETHFHYFELTVGGDVLMSMVREVAFAPPALEIVSIANEPGLTITFRQNIVGFDISRLSAYRFDDISAPTDVSDRFVGISTSVFNGKLLISDEVDGRIKLKYTPEEGEPIWSEPFANSGIYWVDLKGMANHGDGRLEMAYEHNINDISANRVWVRASKNGTVSTVTKDDSLFPAIVATPVDGADFYFLVISQGTSSTGGRLHYSNALTAEV